MQRQRLIIISGLCATLSVSVWTCHSRTSSQAVTDRRRSTCVSSRAKASCGLFESVFCVAAVHCICNRARKQSHCVPDLLGFSATQAMVMPPISESLNRSRKVPLGLDISMSCACCLFTKPRMALRTHTVTHTLKHH